MFCPNCRKEMKEGAIRCIHCGGYLKDDEKKSKRIVQVKMKIEEAEKDLEAAPQLGPWIMLFIGAGTTTVAIFLGGIILVIFGLLIVIIAVVWSNNCTKDQKKLKNEIFQLEGELYNLEKEP